MTALAREWTGLMDVTTFKPWALAMVPPNETRAMASIAIDGREKG